MYHGLSAQFEMDRSYNRPDEYEYGTTTLNPLWSQLKQYNTNYFNNGGYLFQLNYYNRKLWSVFSVRYSEFDLTDLNNNLKERTTTFAYNFVVNHTGLTLKLHYDFRIKQPDGVKWDNDQFRGGFQYVF
jgi:hypothetical protein